MLKALVCWKCNSHWFKMFLCLPSGIIVIAWILPWLASQCKSGSVQTVYSKEAEVKSELLNLIRLGWAIVMFTACLFVSIVLCSYLLGGLFRSPWFWLTGFQCRCSQLVSTQAFSSLFVGFDLVGALLVRKELEATIHRVDFTYFTCSSKSTYWNFS